MRFSTSSYFIVLVKSVSEVWCVLQFIVSDILSACFVISWFYGSLYYRVGLLCVNYSFMAGLDALRNATLLARSWSRCIARP